MGSSFYPSLQQPNVRVSPQFHPNWAAHGRGGEGLVPEHSGALEKTWWRGHRRTTGGTSVEARELWESCTSQEGHGGSFRGSRPGMCSLGRRIDSLDKCWQSRWAAIATQGHGTQLVFHRLLWNLGSWPSSANGYGYLLILYSPCYPKEQLTQNYR